MARLSLVLTGKGPEAPRKPGLTETVRPVQNLPVIGHVD